METLSNIADTREHHICPHTQCMHNRWFPGLEHTKFLLHKKSNNCSRPFSTVSAIWTKPSDHWRIQPWPFGFHWSDINSIIHLIIFGLTFYYVNVLPSNEVSLYCPCFDEYFVLQHWCDGEKKNKIRRRESMVDTFPILARTDEISRAFVVSDLNRLDMLPPSSSPLVVISRLFLCTVLESVLPPSP